MAAPIRSFAEIPGPRNWPVFGNLLLYKFGFYSVDKYHETLLEMRKEYGDVVKENLPGKTVVHLFDPNDAKKVYASEGKKPKVIPLQETVEKYRGMRNLNKGLGNMNGDEWYRLRKSVQPFVMKPKIVSSYLPTVENTVSDLIHQIRKRKNRNDYVENLSFLISKWIFEGAGRIFLEKSLGCFDKGENEARIQKMIESNLRIFHSSSRLKFSLQTYNYFPTPTWRQFVKDEDFFLKHVQDFINEAIDRMRNLQEQGKLNENSSFLRYLISLPELNPEDVFILCFTMLVDGLSTTSPAAVSNLYCLSTNPQVQEKLYQEIKRLISPNEAITEDKLEKMTYLRACVKESFRLFPTGTEISRVIPNDLVLGNYKIPAGTAVDLNHTVLFNCEKTFPNPKEFRPERWINDIKEINPFLMTPFSHGIRTCAGRRFAEQDLFVLLCRILQNFQLEYNTNDVPMQQVYSTLLFPDRVPRIAFRERKI